jgi:trans-2-enoyl-CoA reductase
MYRRDRVKVERKWKKISNMNLNELNEFKKHLEENNQLQSKVYFAVLTRIDSLN